MEVRNELTSCMNEEQSLNQFVLVFRNVYRQSNIKYLDHHESRLGIRVKIANVPVVLRVLWRSRKASTAMEFYAKPRCDNMRANGVIAALVSERLEVGAR